MTPENSETHPMFFATPAAFRRWLAAHHTKETVLWVGFHKKATGRPSITWQEAVDQLLCFGWIDGIRKSLDEHSYVIRVTPRKPRSNWSSVNLRRVAALKKAGQMRPAGLRIFEARDVARTTQYSFERDTARLDAAMEKRFRAQPKAWEFFQSQPPGYRKVASWWVISARQEATRLRRLETLIEDSAAERRIRPLRKAGEGGT